MIGQNDTFTRPCRSADSTQVAVVSVLVDRLRSDFPEPAELRLAQLSGHDNISGVSVQLPSTGALQGVCGRAAVVFTMTSIGQARDC